MIASVIGQRLLGWGGLIEVHVGGYNRVERKVYSHVRSNI